MVINAFRNRPDKDPNIGIVEKIAYGLGDFASQLILTPVSMLFIYYCTEYVNINIAAVAFIMLISRVFDGFSDLFVGYLIERTKSPYGKTRAWILRMLLPYFICGTAIFSVPSSLPDMGKYIYIFLVYNLTVTCVYTAINLPYGALSTLMTQDSYKRSVLVIFRMLGSTAGGTIVMAATLPMVEYFGKDQAAWTITAAILAAMATFAFFLTFFFCHERVNTVAYDETQPEAPVEHKKGETLQAIKRIFHNQYWVMLSIAMLMVCAADIVGGSANTYYALYFLGDDKIIGTLNIISNVAKVAGMLIVVPLFLKKYGKRNSLMFACILMILANVSRYIDPYSVNLNYVIAAVGGFCSGFTYTCLFAMIPDCVEYSEYRDHERHEGLVYSSVSFASKVAGGLGIMISSTVMDLSGYVNGAETQTDTAMFAIMSTNTFIQPGMYVIAIIALCFYKLDAIYDHVVHELKMRQIDKTVAQEQAAAPAATPAAEPAPAPSTGDNR